MTRKESDALLREMRATGIVAKVEHSYVKEAKREKRPHDCISDTCEHYYRCYDDFIRGVGFGAWGLDNTFKGFYEEVRDSTLIEKLSPDFYMWGL